MMTADDCIRAAWQALLRGDTAERDRLCDLARNLFNARDRIRASNNVMDIISGPAILLPDRSNETLHDDKERRVLQ